MIRDSPGKTAQGVPEKNLEKLSGIFAKLLTQVGFLTKRACGLAAD
jgi:hypothetical protein